MSMKYLKGAIIERVEHKVTKRVGNVRLDKRSMWFFARENDAETDTEPFASKSGTEVRDWLLKQLAHTTDEQNMTWMSVVEVASGGEDNSRSYRDSQQHYEQTMELSIDRYYIGLTRDEREWRKLLWEQCDPKSSTFVTENDRYSVSHHFGEGPKSLNLTSHGTRPFKLPAFDYRGGGYSRNTSKVVLAYTPTLWQGLRNITDAIATARKNIAELVGTKDGIAVVAEIGAGKAVLQLNPGDRSSV